MPSVKVSRREYRPGIAAFVARPFRHFGKRLEIDTPFNPKWVTKRRMAVLFRMGYLRHEDEKRLKSGTIIKESEPDEKVIEAEDAPAEEPKEPKESVAEGESAKKVTKKVTKSTKKD